MQFDVNLMINEHEDEDEDEDEDENAQYHDSSNARLACYKILLPLFCRNICQASQRIRSTI